MHFQAAFAATGTAPGVRLLLAIYQIVSDLTGCTADTPQKGSAQDDAGADAVYAGLSKFNARERGENFTADIDTTQYDTLISVDVATKRLLSIWKQ